MHCRQGCTDAGCGMVMEELCASSCPCSPPQESVFGPFPPLPSLEDHSSPPRTPDSQLPGPGLYHLQLGSYLQDDLASGSGCGHGSVPVSSGMEVDFSVPPVLTLMSPTPGPPSPSASVMAEFGSLGGFPLPPPLCPAPVQHPRSLTQ
ncbi:hypothetical protein AALO_G00125150 [Alosa alosa]|uniref:Uncharacterized protein n=1 Tax=Alosa alosa TaxID=278164 RepID=A0AAV6GQM4_9TELE|nr:hypothetical protein AALO_G00125150 [Alosa alosa]